MKIEEYDCVKIKRDAQERIYAKTKDMTPDQLVAYYNQIGDAVRKRQTEPPTKGKTKAS
jgi:hypothetical protein